MASPVWHTRDYLPEVADLLVGRPSLTELARAIGARTEPVLIPWDCADGFFEAYWRRPEAYLDENVRRGISVWARVGPQAEHRAVHSLRNDLASGRWAERNRDLVDLDAAELGLRCLSPEPPHLGTTLLPSLGIGHLARDVRCAQYMERVGQRAVVPHRLAFGEQSGKFRGTEPGGEVIGDAGEPRRVGAGER